MANILRDAIEKVLENVHIETGRTDDFERVVNALEIELSKKILSCELDPYSEENKDFSGYMTFNT